MRRAGLGLPEAVSRTGRPDRPARTWTAAVHESTAALNGVRQDWCAGE